MYLKVILLFMFVIGCTLSPGFKKEPTSKNPKSMGLKQTGVELYFHDLNKINPSSFAKMEDIKKESQKSLQELVSEDIYYYTLGYGDVINISLTDIEDIDGSYTVSPDGSVTIPYVGQVVVNDKTKEEAQEFINNVLKSSM